MKNEKVVSRVLIGIIIILILLIIGGSVYYIVDNSIIQRYNLFSNEKGKLIESIKKIPNPDAKKNVIDSLIKDNSLTQKEANALY